VDVTNYIAYADSRPGCRVTYDFGESYQIYRLNRHLRVLAAAPFACLAIKADWGGV
jgi:hypothetical protein